MTVSRVDREQIPMLEIHEARRVLARASVAIGRASDPEQAFRACEAEIDQALRSLGATYDARQFLRGGAQVAEHVGTPDGARALPPQATRAFCTFAERKFGARPQIRGVTGGPGEGYTFRFNCATTEREGYAVETPDGWFFAPGPVGIEEMAAALTATQRHAALLMRCDPEGFQLERALWPEERDPHGLCARFPLVFALRHRDAQAQFFCGYDPLTDAALAYDIR
jgi:hypothetical protein